MGNEQKAEKRNLVSSFFITVLIGLAFQEAIPPMRSSVQLHGITFGTSMLFICFFLTSIRFFIGNQLPMLSGEMAKLHGNVWLFDLVFIMLQSTLLVFLAGTVSVDESSKSAFTFFGMICLLWIIDLVWILGQWILHCSFLKWRRTSIPWPWFWLNSVLTALTLPWLFVLPDPATTWFLAYFAFLNLVGFFVDVYLCDVFRAL